jgi:hypothetical protein
LEDACPFLKWEIRRDDGRSTLMTLAEDLEEEFGASLGEWHIAKFVDDEELDGGESGLEFEQTLNPNIYDNRTFSLRLGATLGDQFDVGLTSQYIQSTLYSTSDDFLGPESLLSYNGNTEFFTRGFAHMTLFDGRFDQTLGLAHSDYNRIYADPNVVPVVPSLYEGQRVKLDYQGISASLKARF